MPKVWIKNTAELAVTEARKKALQIVSAGLDAIDTSEVVKSAVKIDGDFLTIKGEKIDLKKFRRVIVVGFGKVSATAAYELEKILGDRIFGGAVVDLTVFGLKRIQGLKGTHPKPSQANVDATEKIVELADGISASDLVIAIVSGGGSSLLCWPKEELEQSAKLYDEFLRTGGNIEELNTIRKHISQIKGGGLAKMFYPAKIIGLIFCDIPGGKYNKVASGPTFRDSSTIADAEKILKKYGLKGFYLNETPKEDIYFKNVLNVPLVTNETALNAMAEKGKELRFNPKIISAEIYGTAEETFSELQKNLDGIDLVLAGGEIQLIVRGEGGKGGRNQYLALKAVESINPAPFQQGIDSTERCGIKEDEIFVSFASDGMDNSDAAGAIVDSLTLEKIKDKNLDVKEHLDKYDTYNFFQKTGDLIFTGPTGANVADLMLLLKE